MSDGVCWHYTLVMNVQHAILTLARAYHGSMSPTGGSRCLDCDIIHCAPCPRTVIVSGAVFSSLMTLPHDAPLALALLRRHLQNTVHMVKNLHKASARCRTVWPFGRTVASHTNRARKATLVGEEMKVDEVLARI